MGTRDTAANVADLLRAAAARRGTAPALVTAADTRSWRALDDAADVGAGALAAGGLRPGDRIVIALPTGPQLAAALFAALRAGLVTVPVHPERADLAWVAARTAARAVVTDRPVDGALYVVDSAQVDAWWTQTPAGAQPASAGGEQLALLARAARSGPPVMLSHRAILGAAAAVGAAPRFAIRPDDRVLQVLPLFHVVGLVTAFLPAATVGAAVVIPDAAAAGPVAAALAAVERHRVTVLPAEPTLYRQIDRIPGFDRSLATVRLMTSGSSPLDPTDAVAIRAATGQAVREGYGISEAAAAITSTLMCEAARPGSVGVPYPGVVVRIVGDRDPAGVAADASDATGGERAARGQPGGGAAPADAVAGDGDPGITVDAGEVGPVAIRGDTLFSGYWPDGDGGPGPDGWYVTGDIGYLDDSGELHMVDRVAETVVVAGFTVYPREIEDVLVGHPYVADAAVVGVPGRAGPTIVAALVAAPGKRPTAADLDEFVDGRLAPFKRPTDYRLVDVLPRTEVGRLDREAVRRAFAAADRVGAPRQSVHPIDGARAADAAPALHDLGRRLPAATGRTERSAQDTDEDLF